jgi:hypothetical protein
MKKIKISKSNLKKLKIGWLMFEIINDKYWKDIRKLEKNLEEGTNIKGIEFFFCDNDCVGISNIDRTMDLIHREELS